jgi:ubiquinone/menaquinone biosynthesis C-methylase UbiE
LKGDLDVKLTPVDISSLPANQQQNLYRSLSDFSEMNKEFNTSNSDTIHEKIQKDPQYLVRYHEKLDETRKLWTIDPVKVIANKINNLPIPDRIIAKMVIGDFGCGRAKLAELLNNKMYNFDHHNIFGQNVIACDMKRTPLEKESLDVAVFSLSLMGQNWTDYIAESKRCLRKRGMLMIAETTKSLTARLSGLKNEMTKQGFEIRSEKQEGDFTFIEAMKL